MSNNTVAALLGLVFVLGGCGTKREGLAPSKQLVIATAIPIGGVEPFGSRMGIGANLVDLLYARTHRVASDGVIQPQLAKEVRWENGGHDLRLKLAEARAEDLEFTVQKVKALPGGDFFEAFKNLDQIVVISPDEIVFKLKNFDRAFLTMLGQLPVLRKNSQEIGDEFIVDRQSSDEIVLRRKNPSKSMVNQVVVRVIPSSRRAIRELVAGNVDLLFLVNEGDYKILEELPEIQLQKLNTRLVYGVLDNRGKTLNKKFEWRELEKIIRREEYTRHLGASQVEPAFHSVPQDDPWWNPDLARPPAGQSEASAKSLAPQTKTLSFLGNLYFERRAARILKRQLEAAGITLHLENLPPQQFLTKVLKEKDFDLLMMPFNMKDPLMIHYLVFHSPESEGSLNLTRYSNPQVDAFLEKARYAQDDAESRQAFTQAIQAMMQDPPGLFLFWLKTPIVYRKACSGFSLNSNDFFSSLKDVRCEPSAVN
jgi:ABC-type dipeptide transport system, periplasmic component